MFIDNKLNANALTNVFIKGYLHGEYLHSDFLKDENIWGTKEGDLKKLKSTHWTISTDNLISDVPFPCNLIAEGQKIINNNQYENTNNYLNFSNNAINFTNKENNGFKIHIIESNFKTILNEANSIPSLILPEKLKINLMTNIGNSKYLLLNDNKNNFVEANSNPNVNWELEFVKRTNDNKFS